jgi:hypothetical protein
MATGDTDIKICSDALLMLGASPISRLLQKVQMNLTFAIDFIQILRFVH